MNIPVNELIIKDIIGFSNDMCILEAEKKNYKNDRFFILIKNLNMKFSELLHSEEFTVGDFLKEDLIEVVSNMIVHQIDKDTEADHFIYSDYSGITGNMCDDYYEVRNLFTEKKYRGQNLTKEFVTSVLSKIYEDERSMLHETCIFVQAGISVEEYPDDPTEDYEKSSKIIDSVISFYEKCGFVDVNEISGFEYSCNMYFAPDIASAKIINFYKDALKAKHDAYIDLLNKYKKLESENK